MHIDVTLYVFSYVGRTHRQMLCSVDGEKAPLLAFRGLVSPVKPGDMYFHGCPPGACAGILRIGFQSSGDMPGFTKAELQEIHEWHDRGGKGVYTAPTSGLANVLET